jgi:predicted chitinase
MIKSYKDFLLEDAAADLTKQFDAYTSKLKSLTGIDLGAKKPEENEEGSEGEGTPQSPQASQANPGSTESGEVKSSFSGSKKEMVDLVIKYLNKYQITNPIVQKAILSTIGKESGFEKFKETTYKGTSPARIREVFGKRFSGMSDEEINKVKQDDDAFWEKVYGGEWGRKNLGNTQPGDGAKYVGRGFNGITGRGNYQKYNELLKKNGVNADIIANPTLLNTNKEVAAEVNALFFLMGLLNPTIQRKYGNKGPNDFKDFDTALKAVVNVNAGPGADITKGFFRETYSKAVAASNQFKIDDTKTA